MFFAIQNPPLLFDFIKKVAKCEPIIVLVTQSKFPAARTIQNSLKSGKYADRVDLQVLPAATIDDVARELLRSSYHVIHFR